MPDEQMGAESGRLGEVKESRLVRAYLVAGICIELYSIGEPSGGCSF
jgi:hypothetical protein